MKKFQSAGRGIICPRARLKGQSLRICRAIFAHTHHEDVFQCDLRSHSPRRGLPTLQQRSLQGQSLQDLLCDLRSHNTKMFANVATPVWCETISHSWLSSEKGGVWNCLILVTPKNGFSLDFDKNRVKNHLAMVRKDMSGPSHSMRFYSNCEMGTERRFKKRTRPELKYVSLIFHNSVQSKVARKLGKNKQKFGIEADRTNNR